MIDEKIDMRWIANRRVDFVDKEILNQMWQACYWFISLGIESGSEEELKRAHKGISLENIEWTLRLPMKVNIKN